MFNAISTIDECIQFWCYFLREYQLAWKYVIDLTKYDEYCQINIKLKYSSIITCD